jgi:hypothetical protein
MWYNVGMRKPQRATTIALNNKSEWARLYESGMAPKYIAKKYRVGAMTVRKYLILDGVKLRSLSEIQMGEHNGMYKGHDAKITYAGLHRWVWSRLPKPDICPQCNIRPAFDLANIRNDKNPDTYTRDLKNWEWLCRKCHMVKDGRINNLRQFQNG